MIPAIHRRSPTALRRSGRSRGTAPKRGLERKAQLVVHPRRSVQGRNGALLAVIPALKCPPNPPAGSLDATITQRTLLYLMTVVPSTIDESPGPIANDEGTIAFRGLAASAPYAYPPWAPRSSRG